MFRPVLILSSVLLMLAVVVTLPSAQPADSGWKTENLPLPEGVEPTWIQQHGLNVLLTGKLAQGKGLWLVDGLKLRRINWKDGTDLVAYELLPPAVGPKYSPAAYDPAYVAMQHKADGDKRQWLMPWSLIEIRNGVASLVKQESPEEILSTPVLAYTVGDSTWVVFSGPKMVERIARIKEGRMHVVTTEDGKPAGGNLKLRLHPDGAATMKRYEVRNSRVFKLDGDKLVSLDVPMPEGKSSELHDIELVFEKDGVVACGTDKEWRGKAWVVRNGKAEWIVDEAGNPLTGMMLGLFHASGKTLLCWSSQEKNKAVNEVFQISGSLAKRLDWNVKIKGRLEPVDGPAGSALLVNNYRDPENRNAIFELCVLTDKGVQPLKLPNGDPAHTLERSWSRLYGDSLLTGFLDHGRLKIGVLDGQVLRPLKLPEYTTDNLIFAENQSYNGNPVVALDISRRSNQEGIRVAGLIENAALVPLKDAHGRLFQVAAVAGVSIYGLVGDSERLTGLCRLTR